VGRLCTECARAWQHAARRFRVSGDLMGSLRVAPESDTQCLHRTPVASTREVDHDETRL